MKKRCILFVLSVFFCARPRCKQQKNVNEPLHHWNDAMCFILRRDATTQSMWPLKKSLRRGNILGKQRENGSREDITHKNTRQDMSVRMPTFFEIFVPGTSPFVVRSPNHRATGKRITNYYYSTSTCQKNASLFFAQRKSALSMYSAYLSGTMATKSQDWKCFYLKGTMIYLENERLNFTLADVIEPEDVKVLSTHEWHSAFVLCGPEVKMMTHNVSGQCDDGPSQNFRHHKHIHIWAGVTWPSLFRGVSRDESANFEQTIVVNSPSFGSRCDGCQASASKSRWWSPTATQARLEKIEVYEGPYSKNIVPDCS